METLQNAEPSSILFQGKIVDSSEGFYINGTEKMLKYIVCRGGAVDWCIYVEDCYRDMDWSEVKTNGNKIFKSTAKVVIDADEEVWNRWRN